MNNPLRLLFLPFVPPYRLILLVSFVGSSASTRSFADEIRIKIGPATPLP
jgi:hypothetical protein